MTFLPIQLLNQLSCPFHLTYGLSPFPFIIFLTLNYFWFVFCNFLCKTFQQFLCPYFTNNMSTEKFFKLFNHKNFFRLIWNIAFCQIVFIFWNSNNITNFKFRVFIINFFTRDDLASTSFILIVLWYVLLYLLIILSNLSIYIFFDIEVMYL